MTSNPLLTLFHFLLLIICPFAGVVAKKHIYAKRSSSLKILAPASIIATETYFYFTGHQALFVFSLLLAALGTRLCVPVITGGIGSGKSTLGQYLSEKGFVLLNADIIAAEVTRPGTLATGELIRAFGSGVSTQEGHIDRNKLREIVFTDDAGRRLVERALHKYIALELAKRVLIERVIRWKRVVLEIPLLYKSPFANFCGPIIVCGCSEETRLERLKTRAAHVPPESFRSIMKKQTPAELLANWGEIYVDNEGTREEFIRQAEIVANRIK